MDDVTETEGSIGNTANTTKDKEESSASVHSTKRPLCCSEPKSVTKRRKKELDKDMILHKALSCMEKDPKKDEDDIFGQYVATELRSIKNQQIKRFTKWRIQSLIYSAHSGLAGQPEPTCMWHHAGQAYGQYNQTQFTPHENPYTQPSNITYTPGSCPPSPFPPTSPLSLASDVTPSGGSSNNNPSPL